MINKTQMPRPYPGISMLALMLLCSALSLFGQVTGTLRVFVTDSSGAVIPGSQVTAVNVDTNETLSGSTNENGYAVFTPIPRGKYNLRISIAGFANVKVDDVTLDTGQNRQVQVQMQVEGVTSTVDVAATAVALQTETASLGALVTGDTVTNMPLSQRRYTDLALLTPGAISATNAGSGQVNATDVLVNGGRIRGNNFQLDGFDNNGPARVGVLGTNVIVPPPDALTEFKVQSGNFSAEFGTAIGAVISVSLKSGTNEVHGGAWLFNRDTRLAANTWQNNHTLSTVGGVTTAAAKAPLQWNQPGGMIGGPLIKDKLFYFGDFEAFRQVSSTNPLASVPSAAMRNGDFSALTAPLADPNGGTFPGNIIPPGRIVPLGQKILNLFPQPNTTGTVSAGRPANNYTRSTETQLTTYKMDFRMDYNRSAKDHFFGRYSFSSSKNLGQAVLGAASGDPITKIRNQQGSLGWTKTISAETVNELRFSRSNQVYDATTTNVGEKVASKFGFLGIPAISDINLPSIAVTNYNSLGAGGYNPQYHRPWAYSFSDSLSRVKGKHLVKFGGSFSIRQDDFVDFLYRSTGFSFQGRYTGDAAADILLGLPQSVSAEGFSEVHERQQIYGAYVQDQWKITPRLSIDAGIRYELYTPFYGVGDYTNVNYDFVKKQLVVAPGGSSPLSFGAVAAKNKYAMGVDTNNWMPRLGLAYQIHQRLVFRGAYGLFYDSRDVHGTSPDSIINAPNVYAVTLQRAGTGPAPATLTQPFPANILDPAAISSSTLPLNVFPQVATASRVPQWNVTLQYQITNGSTFEVAYVGNKASDLDLVIQGNNAPWGLDGTISANRPYPEWLSMLTIVRGDYGWSKYNALQAKYDRRGNSWSTLTSFTYASAIGTTDSTTATAGNLTQTILATPTGPAPVVDTAFANAFPRLRLTNGVNLRMPVGHGQRFLTNMNRVADAIIGGWEASFILSANSGLPLNVTMGATGTDPATGKAYTFLSSQGGGTIRPNRVGNPRTGIDPSEDRLHYLDSAAFQLQTLNTPGNAARNSSWGPGLFNVDMTLSKSFTINERQHVDIRLEGFNALNHTNYSAPSAVWGGPTFGQITTAGPNRVVQMGVKYSF